MKHNISASLILTLMLVSVNWRAIAYGKLTAIQPAVATILSVDTIQIVASKDNSQECDRKNGCHDTLALRVFKVVEKAATDCDKKDGCYPDNPRGPIANPNTPYIISPSDDTALLNDKPSISWHAVPGAIDYTVRLLGIGSGLDWERTVDNSSKLDLGEIKMLYPDDAPALQPGITYKLIVEARSQATQKRIEAETTQFRMLSKENIEQVREAVEKIDKSSLSKEEKAFRRWYDVYKDKNLIAETIEMLELLVTEGSQKPQVYSLLGKIYQEQGLVDFAKVRYETAVRLATTAQDSQELEAAQTGLNKTNELLKKRDGVAP